MAAPSVFKRETSCPKSKQFTDKDWCSDVKADNVDIRASDDKTDYGSVNPGDIIALVREHCKDGICEDGPWSIDSKWITNPDGDENDKGTVEGSVIVDVVSPLLDPVHMDPMLDSLQYTLDRLKDFTKDHKDSTTWCTSSGCSGTPAIDLEHTKGPSAIKMEIRDDNAGDKSIYDKPIVSSITLTFTQQKENGGLSGLCSGIIGAASGIVGGVNPVLGAIGSLATLGCM
ncbi:hypothetical protein F4777DRAFT_544079 [Nemania sp. FL0916]|nr:hypothetical protein F4777DRAFT_544079 [Nemania sp. FL0916]